MKTILLYAATILLLTGCSRYYYAPNMHNVPLFKDKGEARLAGGVSSGDEISSVEVQAAYSFTDHIGVMANYFNTNGGGGNNTGKGSLFEGAVGYFGPIKGDFRYEVFVGYGRGKVTSYYDANGTSKLGIDKVFIQPAIGYTRNFLDVAVSAKVATSNFFVKDVDTSNATAMNDMRFIRDNHHSYLFEPALTVRGGWKYAKLQLQYGYSFNLTNPNFKQEKYNLGIALYFSFAERFRKKGK